MGTAAAWREDELAGAAGGLAIFVTAVATTILLPAYLPGAAVACTVVSLG
jgi:putative effector of murein hydrolase